MENVTAVIINWNTVAHLRRCVESFVKEGVEPSDLLVVDQGSSDGSQQMLATEFPGVHVLQQDENSGFAHAANRGIARVVKPLVIVANADTVVRPDSLRALIEPVLADDRIALCGPRLLNEAGHIVTRLSRTSILRGLLLEVFPRTLRGLWRDTERMVREESGPSDITYVEGAFFAVRKRVYDDLGGMDEGFSFFFEDADLPLRLLKTGHRVIHVPASTIVHVGGASFSQVPTRHASEFYKNMLRLYHRHALRRALWLERGLRLILGIKLVALSLGEMISLSSAGRAERNRVIRSSLSRKKPIRRLPEDPRVSVIVPTWKREELLLRLLDRLNNQTSRSFEVIIVDQNDRPLPVDPGVFSFSLTHVRTQIKNRSAAKNRGVRASKGDLIVFLDDDIEPDQGLIQAHLDAHRDPLLGAVSCRVLEDGLPKLSTTKICRVSWYGKLIDGFQSDVTCEVETMVGANMSLKREAITEVGSFEALFRGTSIFEEQDFSDRLRSLGWKILFTNKSFVKHFVQPDGNVGIRESQPAEYYHDFHHNEMVFFLKNRNHWLLFFVIPFCFLRSVKQSMSRRLSFREAIHMFSGVFAGISSYYASLK